MIAKYKGGDVVYFKSVSKKYACFYGLIINVIKCYTDESLRFPHHPNNKVLSITTDSKTGYFICYGYIVQAYNTNNIPKEIVVITEEFIKGIKDG